MAIDLGLPRYPIKAQQRTKRDNEQVSQQAFPSSRLRNTMGSAVFKRHARLYECVSIGQTISEVKRAVYIYKTRYLEYIHELKPSPYI